MECAASGGLSRPLGLLPLVAALPTLAALALLTALLLALIGYEAGRLAAARDSVRHGPTH